MATSTQIRTINVASANLYVLAAKYLGQAEQWYRIANLNGLTDFLVAGPITLKIPPRGTSNGGVLGI